ncbi:MAG: hypothetical protein HQM00_16215 [Magnetococcales bacterium]|nr:hypothetical protein [Magnetococcales bacterium]
MMEKSSVGFVCGQDWAKHRAKPIELKRLVDSVNRIETLAHHNIIGNNATYTAYEVVAFIVLDIDPDRSRVKGFWASVFGDASVSDAVWQDNEFAIDFIKGAISFSLKYASQF